MRTRQSAVVLISSALFLLGATSTSSVGASPHAYASQRLPLDELSGVTALSATDAWAVGDSYTNLDNTLILHWDGRSWTRVPSPNPGESGQFGSGLLAVSAVSASDAWAVGIEFPAQSSVILHWDGSSWKQVASPGILLSGVSTVSATDAWAVGSCCGGRLVSSLILHWDGSSWKIVKSLGGGSSVSGVSALSATDAWAVGSSRSKRSLILHWDGRSWRQVASPNPSTHGNGLEGVSARSSTDAWAVGGAGLFLHWNGKSWKQVKPVKNTGAISVSTQSSSDAWAVGLKVTLHWNGKYWKSVKNPVPGLPRAPEPPTLLGVSAISPRDAWAVGGTGDGKTIILHWNGNSWKRVPSPN
jgi:hypothetical protein